jgi:hypothetical protein
MDEQLKQFWFKSFYSSSIYWTHSIAQYICVSGLNEDERIDSILLLHHLILNSSNELHKKKINEEEYVTYSL